MKEACVLCEETLEVLENEGTHERRDHWMKNPHGDGFVWREIEVPCDNPDKNELIEHHTSYFSEEKITVCRKCHHLIHNDDEFIGTKLRPPIGHQDIYYGEGIFKKDDLKYEGEANQGFGGFKKDYKQMKIIYIKRIKVFVCPICEHINAFEQKKKINIVVCSECGFDWDPPFDENIKKPKVREVYIYSFDEPYRIWTEETGHTTVSSKNIKIIEEEELEMDDECYYADWYKKSKKVKAIIEPKSLIENHRHNG